MEKKHLVNGEKKAINGQKDKKIRVLLVDDHLMMRQSLRMIIDAQDDLTVIGEASNGEEAVKLARETRPQVIVMDVNMPFMNGIEATQKIASTMPEVCIVGLSLHDSQEVINSMRSAGASAYIMKSEASESLCFAIRSEA